MSTVQEIARQLEKLSRVELLQIREWLDNVLEDQLSFSEEFEAQILESECDMAQGTPTRTRQAPALR